MVNLYILLEIVSLLMIILTKVFSINNINFIIFFPILLNSLFVFKKDTNIKLRISLLVVLIADFIFNFYDSCTVGISLFIIVQLLYYFCMRKNSKSFKVLILLSIMNVALAMLFNEKIIYVEAIIYGLLSLINIIKFSLISSRRKTFILFRNSLILLFICDITILLQYIFASNIILFSIEWITYVISQVLLVVYICKWNDAFLYRFLQPVFKIIFKIFYRPKIVNKHYIPKEGRAIIAGNHKHALDPILVDASTKRVVHTLAKKDLHDGKFGWFFRAIGTIPVDLKAKRNQKAQDSSIDFLNKDCLINLSPEAKRNYTDELLLPFKYGAVSMAKKTNSVIVPYSITGNYKLFHNDLKIVFGEPIDVSNMEIEKANELLFNRIKKLLIDNMDISELKKKKISRYRGVVSEKSRNDEYKKSK